jgi:hypothetical protein
MNLVAGFFKGAVKGARDHNAARPSPMTVRRRSVDPMQQRRLRWKSQATHHFSFLVFAPSSFFMRERMFPNKVQPHHGEVLWAGRIAG